MEESQAAGPDGEGEVEGEGEVGRKDKKNKSKKSKKSKKDKKDSLIEVESDMQAEKS
jgi:hypothetical protein